MPCEPAPPCEPTFPLFCEPLATTTSGQRVVVEDLSSCEKTIPKSTSASILHQNFLGNLVMSDGSDSAPIRLPQMSNQTSDEAPKIMVLLSNGTIKAWEPSNTGDNFIAYWDGNSWKIGNFSTILPLGDGVLVRDTVGSLSFVNGSSGESLQYVGTNIGFAPQSPTPIPTGFIIPFAGNVTAIIPSGYLECDGSAVSQSTYVNLYTVIGSLYSDGTEGFGNFRLPDLRGYFIRGFGTNRDGTPSGPLGSKQVDSIPDHTHSFQSRLTSASFSLFSGSTSVTSPSLNTSTTANVVGPYAGGTESRPRNIAMRYLIKT